MKKLFYLLLICLILPAAAFAADKEKKNGYIGSESCKSCHEEIYNYFIDSGHPFKLRKAELAEASGFPLPTGYTWDDISYTIGGEIKKMRYIGNDGYVITAAKDGSPLKTQYNILTGTWSNYHPGEVKPYKCGPCHMTNYKPEGNQDGKPGMIGTWTFDGIECEECHGPSSLHVANPEAMKPKIDTSSAACGKCHIRSDKNTIPSKGGFIRHHEQYNELLGGSHKDLGCVDCHNPHAKVVKSIKVDCASCHEDVAAKYAKEEFHGANKIDCIECHMPKASKSAVAEDTYVGDTRTHIFVINTSADYSMFDDKGKLTDAKLGLEFSCVGACHKGRDSKWASKKAKGFHK
ncbi:MAG: hypothetical protein C0602_06725 [Denitrovibrio sp.]|nr:MAG: hypothetical protein C0602_06725 [Denitrovibrio sp.]